MADDDTTSPADSSPDEGGSGDDAKKRYLEALERKRGNAAGPGRGGPGSTGGSGHADTHGHTQRTFRRKSGGGG